MAKILAILFLILGVVRLVFDWLASPSLSEFAFAPFGQVWASIHFGSLQVTQPAIERYLSPDIWEYGVLPALLWPAAPVLLVLAVLFWLIRRRKPVEI